MTGQVKFFNSEKGYGFLFCDDSDEQPFYHHLDLPEGCEPYPGMRLRFEVRDTDRGPRAYSIEVIG